MKEAKSRGGVQKGVLQESGRRLERGVHGMGGVCVCVKTKGSAGPLTPVGHTGCNGTIQTASSRVSAAQTFPESWSQSAARTTRQRDGETSAGCLNT